MSEQIIQNHKGWTKAIIPASALMPDGRVRPEVNVIPMALPDGRTIMTPSDLWHMPCPLADGDVLTDKVRRKGRATWRAVYGVEVIMGRQSGSAAEICHMVQYLPTMDGARFCRCGSCRSFF